jgi:hypothetical protein
MSTTDETDPYKSPAYAFFVNSMAKYCHCEGCGNCTVSRPCDAVLAGGVCDQVTCDCDESRGPFDDEDDDVW